MMDGLNPFPNEDFIRKAAIAISFFLRAALKDRLKKGKKTNPKKTQTKTLTSLCPSLCTSEKQGAKWQQNVFERFLYCIY